MVNYNAVGLNLSGVTGVIDAYSARRREEEAKQKRAALYGGYADNLLGETAASGGAGGGAPSRAQEMMGIGRQPAFSGGGQKMAMPVDPDLVPAVVDEATKRGLNPKDVLTAMSYETGGTLHPWQAGPKTKWGQHRGLIQWGEPQAAQYGVTAQTPVRDQVTASMKYLEDRGVRPGHGLMEIYSAINAGGVGPQYARRSDTAAGGAPGTVADKVAGQMGGHAARAEALIARHKAPAGVTQEAGTQQIQTASSADADMPAASGTPVGQFSLPGGRGVTSGPQERRIPPQLAQQLRAMIQSGDEDAVSFAMKEIQRLRAGPKYEFKTAKDGSIWRTDDRGNAEKIGGQEGGGAAPLFGGTGLEAQGLNQMVERGEITPQQASQYATAKIIADERGQQRFVTPQEFFAAQRATQGGVAGAAQPVGPAAGSPSAPVGGGGIGTPITGPKQKESVKLTAEQERNRGLFVSAIGEAPIVEDTFKDMQSMQGIIGERVAGITGYRGLTPATYQRGADAIERIAQAALYSTSGATAPVEEVKKTAASVTPMPGEDARTIADKRERLNRMIESIRQKAAFMEGQGPDPDVKPTGGQGGWTDVGGGFKIRQKN